MNLFQIKTVCALVLWAISVTFGVFLPYFLWKISLHDVRANTENSEQEDGSERDDQCSKESDNLILGRSDHNPKPTGFSTYCKRLTSSLKVKVANGKFSSIIYCFCGGVFLGVSLLDLIPQSRLAVKTVFEGSKTVTSYPVAEFMVTLGLLLVMIIENMVSEFMLPENSRQHLTTQAERQSTSGDGNRDFDVRFQQTSRLRDNISLYRMYILVVTLSLHSVFEGLAIGLQKELPTMLQLVIAVSVHKAVLTLGVGMPLFETLGKLGRIKTALFCSVIFCSASPIGCFAGAFVSSDYYNTSSPALLASAVLQCLATGTFLYVTFVEVIPREFSHHSGHHAPQANGRSGKMRHVQDSNDSALADHSDPESELTATTNESTANAKFRRQSKLVKLLALIAGFAVASGLQFL